MATNNLRKVMTEEGFSQAQLAHMSGVSSGTINKIFNKKRRCAPKTNHKILKGLNAMTDNKYSYEELFPADEKY